MIQIVPLESGYYDAYYALVQSTAWGNPMLPMQYNSSLWGMVLLDDGTVVGGWVGTLRGDKRLVRLLAKSVYFDSYPVFATTEVENGYADKLLDAVRDYAHASKVIMLNLTHWVRGNGLMVDTLSKEATFCTALHDMTTEQLWQQVESKQRNCIRKGEKSGVEVVVCRGEESLQYLSEYQALRQATQQHAIHQHAQASMLLKSDAFFAEKFRDPKATLFVAKVEGQVAAVALMLYAGGTVYYYSGGSKYDLNRKYCCSAFLLWKAICYYNELGADCFDMGGVPVKPTAEHPAYGVYAFKRSFGGEYREFDGGTIIISPRRYRLLQWALSQRKLLRVFSSKL